MGRRSEEIRFSTFVRAPRELVYGAMTSSDGLDAWFTTGAAVDPTPGGRMVWRWRDWGPNAAGWGEALTLMKVYVEHGVRY